MDGYRLGSDLRAVHVARGQIHLVVTTARHPLVGDAAVGGTGQTRATLGAQVGTIERSTRSGSGRDVLRGFAVIDCGICFGGSRKGKTDDEGRGEDQGFHGCYFLSCERGLFRPCWKKHRTYSNPLDFFASADDSSLVRS